jgi:hypothetical protein
MSPAELGTVLITGGGPTRGIGVVVFVASPDAAHLTGATIDVDGGSHLH